MSYTFYAYIHKYTRCLHYCHLWRILTPSQNVFSADWETIRMKCNIALLWLFSLANSSTQEADVHTPVTISTEKHGAKERKS